MLGEPLANDLQGLHQHAYSQSMPEQNASINSLWSAQGAAENVGSENFSMSNSSGQSVPNLMASALPNHTFDTSDFFSYPQDSNEEVDLGVLLEDQNSSSDPRTTMDLSKTTSANSSADSMFARDSETSLSRASSVLSNLSCTRLLPGTISNPRQSLSNEMETACRNSGGSCLASAVETLQALHIPPLACLYSTNEDETLADKRRPRRTDSVLATNRNAIRRLSGFLQCSCLSFSQVQLVLVIICSKLIAWYRAVLHDLPGECSDPSTSAGVNDIDGSSETGAAGRRTDERVQHQRFAVGDYSLDIGLESKIRAQVIASEIKQLEAVIENLSNRLQNEDCNQASSDLNAEPSQNMLTIDSPGLSNAVHTRLTAHLQRQLQEAKEEISKDQ